MNLSRPRYRPLIAAICAVAVMACDDPFQVIEELEFDPSLSVDLAQMELLPSGVYIQDLVPGSGAAVVAQGSDIETSYAGYLADGTLFGSGEFDFVVGAGRSIAGYSIGVIGMQQGGERKIVIPPDLAYADSEQNGIPAGSVLIFDVTMDSILTGSQ